MNDVSFPPVVKSRESEQDFMQIQVTSILPLENVAKRSLFTGQEQTTLVTPFTALKNGYLVGFVVEAGERTVFHIVASLQSPFHGDGNGILLRTPHGTVSF